MDVVDVIHRHPDLHSLSLAIANADFIPLLRNMKENFTLFAPNDDAFYPEHLDTIINDKTETFEILSRHKIVGHGRFTTDKFEKGVLITINNYSSGLIALFRNETTDVITAIEHAGESKYRTIVERDIHASNGVIHIIDGVL